MKSIVFFSLIVLFAFTGMISCSNGNQAGSEDGPQKDTKSGNLNAEPVPGGNSLAKSISDDALEGAHRIFPAYPGAELDETKGSYSSSELGDTYNLVYYTDDSTKQVLDYFMVNVSRNYMERVSPPENMDWIELHYYVEGVGHEGTILIRKTESGNTEIVYMLQRKDKSK